MSETDKWALLSVYSKDGITGFAQKLVGLGWHLLASGGTCRHLREAGLEVKDVADLVGGGAILGHRVVTLSREVHAGLLARDCQEDRDELARLNIPRIEMVCCDFYPLAEEIAKAGVTVDAVVEQTDIGGPTMVRSAAKGGRIVICDPEDRALVTESLKTIGDVDAKTRQYLRAKAEAIVSGYCLDAARFHSGGEFDGVVGQRLREVAYGENRDQNPAYLYGNLSPRPHDPLALARFSVVSGNPSYISFADGDKAISILRFLAESFRRNFHGTVPYIAVICKHGNPCGAAFDWKYPYVALQNALLGDPIACMGGELVTNFEITDELGTAIFAVPKDLVNLVGRKNWGLDVIFAPEFSATSIELLGKREKRRLFSNPVLLDPPMSSEVWMRRPVPSGWLQQKAPWFIFDQSSLDITWRTTEEQFVSVQLGNLLLAQVITWRATSNTVALAKDSMLIGLGCGQQDRIACVQLCLDRARRSGHDTNGAVFASDAFFPYAEHGFEGEPLEGPELLVQAGCVGGVVPADGKELPKVQEYFSKNGVSVAYLPPEDRGFAGH
ncbi:MAG: hypothetical protein WCX08_02995 [Candidatus Buchananbacteria bacterium]|jgi:phosphoribosylaminoimidazolecarboxamide formyltransferase/IMP cyclohydrolase